MLLPLLHLQHNLLAPDVLLTVLQRFIFVVVLMFPFELGGLKYDHPKLARIPQRIGIQRTKIVGMTLLILFFLIEFLKNEASILSLMVLLIFLEVMRTNYYSGFWDTGLPVL